MTAIAATADPFAFLDAPTAVPASAITHEPPQSVAPAAEASVATPAATAARSTRKSAAKNQIVFLDLETIPDYARYESFGLPPVPQPAEYLAPNEGPAPSELIKSTVDETKAAIAAALVKAGGKKLRREIVKACIDIEKKSQKPRKGVIDLFADMVAAIDGEEAAISEAVAANNKAMAVCPEMNKIVAFGWAIGDDPAQSLVLGMQRADGTGTVTEAEILDRIWTVISSVGSGPVCGFNVLEFDLPTIYVRSVMNKIKPRRKLDMKKYGNNDVLDLMTLRYPSGRPRGLGWLARVNGIRSELPDVDGSHVGDLYAAGEFDKIGAYVRDDVNITRSYHRMYAGGFWP